MASRASPRGSRLRPLHLELGGQRSPVDESVGPPRGGERARRAHAPPRAAGVGRRAAHRHERARRVAPREPSTHRGLRAIPGSPPTFRSREEDGTAASRRGRRRGSARERRPDSRYGARVAGAPVASAERLDTGDAYFFGGDGSPAPLPVYRVVLRDAENTRYHGPGQRRGGREGRSQRARLPNGCTRASHRLDFSATLRQRPAWDPVEWLVLLSASSRSRPLGVLLGMRACSDPLGRRCPGLPSRCDRDALARSALWPLAGPPSRVRARPRRRGLDDDQRTAGARGTRAWRYAAAVGCRARRDAGGSWGAHP